jgi:hypothetical protein
MSNQTFHLHIIHQPMSMFRLTLLLLALCIGQSTIAQTLTKTIPGFQSPESVAEEKGGRYLYVSNVGPKLEPTTEDGDGFISRLTRTGEVDKLKFITGLNAPKGMAIVGSTLYVTDINKVYGYSLPDGKRVKTFTLDKSIRFLNDLVAQGDAFLFTSATDNGIIYRIDLRTDKIEELKVDDLPPGVNGLCIAGEMLYLNTYMGTGEGRCGTVDLRAAKLKFIPLAEMVGDFDGIFTQDGRIVLASSWANPREGAALLRWEYKPISPVEIQAPGSPVTQLSLPKDMKSPADFLYISETGTLYLPDMMGNRLLVFSYDLQ